MKVKVAQDRVELGTLAAAQAADLLRKSLQRHELCNLVVATGSSQFEVLDSLVQQPGIAWDRVCGFHLDEYLGVDRSHPASFCGYLQKRFVERVPLKSFVYLDGALPAEQLLQSANAALEGQRIDLLLCGIGENGHLAFNDPPADFAATSPYLIVELDQACRKQQVGEGWFDSISDVPTQAISMSIAQILKAEAIICSVPDRRKAEAVRATLEDDVSPAIPASALRQHANTTLVLDTTSASLLATATLAEFGASQFA
ncbi:MAG: glucosamine-6-phosphate deaminase [Planctomycetales bacterium]|nr:glucosamine-6-phosphate deaminase [Planctomycetales bacterium]MCA9182967.1 glucosamine-6-phosphate deaminase [Planctomycetales bacterium]